MNIGDLLKNARQMQENIKKLQKEFEQREFTGESGGGMVTATMNGKGYLLSVKLDPDAIDFSDLIMVEELIAAAVNGCKMKVDQSLKEHMSGWADRLPVNGLNFD